MNSKFSNFSNFKKVDFAFKEQLDSLKEFFIDSVGDFKAITMDI